MVETVAPIAAEHVEQQPVWQPHGHECAVPLWSASPEPAAMSSNGAIVEAMTGVPLGGTFTDMLWADMLWPPCMLCSGHA
jgi:hypothetical protein